MNKFGLPRETTGFVTNSFSAM